MYGSATREKKRCGLLINNNHSKSYTDSVFVNGLTYYVSNINHFARIVYSNYILCKFDIIVTDREILHDTLHVADMCTIYLPV